MSLRKSFMPNLDTRSTHEFWKNYEDPMIYRVIAFMESTEKWTIDENPDIAKMLNQLGEALEGLTRFDLSKEEQYIEVLCHLRMAKVLRIMQAIDTIYPGSASRLLMHAEQSSKNQNESAELFLRRNVAFERLRLLARVFSPERFALISKVLEKEVGDE